ncbi:MAG: hypothetical protein ABIG60_02300 [Patescibacteria group bacterium]
MQNKFDLEAKVLAKKYNFKILKKKYTAFSLNFGDYRNAIYEIIYNNKPAILKIYHEDRITDEPLALKYYSKINTSKILLAPKLYKYEIISSKKGWLIMEKINGKTLKSPLNKKGRQEFLKLFLIYRKNFPKKSYKNLNLVENLKANEYHIYRINKWLKMANERQAEDKLNLLKENEFISRYRKVINLINKEFKNRRMVLCHGHFKAKEIFKINDNKYYLSDFGHTKMYPEGYEFAFIIWADYLIPGNWRLNYQEWKKGIDNWIKDLDPIAKKLKIKKFSTLIKTSLAERALGTILADVRASDKPKIEQIERINLLYKLIDDLCKK